MKHYGIKTPEGIIWWISDSEYKSWRMFFDYGTTGDGYPHVLPLATAIKAYGLIGYKVVKVEIKEKINE